MLCDKLHGHFLGTDLKFAINIKAKGFDMTTDSFAIVLRCGSVEHEVNSDELTFDEEEGQCFLRVDTTAFPAGVLKMIVTAQVPDNDFPAGARREVGVMDLCILCHK